MAGTATAVTTIMSAAATTAVSQRRQERPQSDGIAVQVVMAAAATVLALNSGTSCNNSAEVNDSSGSGSVAAAVTAMA